MLIQPTEWSEIINRRYSAVFSFTIYKQPGNVPQAIDVDGGETVWAVVGKPGQDAIIVASEDTLDGSYVEIVEPGNQGVTAAIANLLLADTDTALLEQGEQYQLDLILIDATGVRYLLTSGNLSVRDTVLVPDES